MYDKSVILKSHKTHNNKMYMYFTDHTHPLANKCGVVYYHRHVASLKVGYWLTPEENVHHKDGNSLNNVPDNLEIVSRAEHTVLHHNTSCQTIICVECGTPFKQRTVTTKFCSKSCRADARKKFNVSKKDLEKLVWEIPSTCVAERFGVSSASIAKRCKKFGISKPPRGYWGKLKRDKVSRCSV